MFAQLTVQVTEVISPAPGCVSESSSCIYTHIIKPTIIAVKNRKFLHCCSPFYHPLSFPVCPRIRPLESCVSSNNMPVIIICQRAMTFTHTHTQRHNEHMGYLLQATKVSKSRFKTYLI